MRILDLGVVDRTKSRRKECRAGKKETRFWSPFLAPPSLPLHKSYLLAASSRLIRGDRLGAKKAFLFMVIRN